MNITLDDVDSALAFLRDRAVEAAEARATRIYMESWVKSALAIEMKKHADQPLAAQEREARVSAPYLAALQALREAVQEDEKHRFWRAAAEAKIEVWRTIEATRRAEGRAYA
jgi:hypothetical protein